jgi:hypothetical protein
VRITQDAGARIRVSSDACGWCVLAEYVDGTAPYRAGRLGLYAEDAAAAVDYVAVSAAPADAGGAAR